MVESFVAGMMISQHSRSPLLSSLSSRLGLVLFLSSFFFRPYYYIFYLASMLLLFRDCPWRNDFSFPHVITLCPSFAFIVPYFIESSVSVSHRYAFCSDYYCITVYLFDTHITRHRLFSLLSSLVCRVVKPSRNTITKSSVTQISSCISTLTAQLTKTLLKALYLSKTFFLTRQPNLVLPPHDFGTSQLRSII